MGIENYVGIPLIIVALALAARAWRGRLSLLLLIGCAFVIAIAIGPNLVVTSVKHTYPLPWAGLWNLPVARSAEPSRFIVFAVLALALALALWLALPAKSKLLGAARWGLGLLAVTAIITDAPTSYQAVNPLPPGYRPPATMHAVNQLPAFITDGMYRHYLHSGETVVILTHQGNAGMLFQAAADFYFRIAGGYINASLTPVNALPHPATLLAHPSKAAIRMFDDYARSSGLGVIVVEQAWEEPWMNLSKLGMRGTSVGGVTIYPMGPWLAGQAHPGALSPGIRDIALDLASLTVSNADAITRDQRPGVTLRDPRRSSATRQVKAAPRGTIVPLSRGRGARRRQRALLPRGLSACSAF